MRATATLLVLLSGSAQAAQCLSYSGEVEIVGKLSRYTFPEQPGYESIANGDAAATYFFVSPSRPLCVVEGGVDDNEPSENNITRVQLVVSRGTSVNAYNSLRPLLGNNIKCAGNIFHSISGHHHSPVLLSEAASQAPSGDVFVSAALRQVRGSIRILESGRYENSTRLRFSDRWYLGQPRIWFCCK